MFSLLWMSIVTLLERWLALSWEEEEEDDDEEEDDEDDEEDDKEEELEEEELEEEETIQTLLLAELSSALSACISIHMSSYVYICATAQRVVWVAQRGVWVAQSSMGNEQVNSPTESAKSRFWYKPMILQ